MTDITWRKSSYSGGDGGHCVELARLSGHTGIRDLTTWRKSSHSGTQGGSECVEVGRLPETIAFRDSKDPDGPQLHVTRDAFCLILATLKG